MIISVINHTKDIPDEEVHAALRSINRQIEFDFRPYWSKAATLRLEGRSGKRVNRETLSDMRGDAVLYLWDEADVDDALGYHERNHRHSVQLRSQPRQTWEGLVHHFVARSA
jgi:hypothetical protein